MNTAQRAWAATAFDPRETCPDRVGRTRQYRRVTVGERDRHRIFPHLVRQETMRAFMKTLLSSTPGVAR